MKKILAFACALSLSACASTNPCATDASGGGGFMEGVGYALADRLFDSIFGSTSEPGNSRQKRGWVQTSVSSPR